jgi:hypothetical protein
MLSIANSTVIIAGGVVGTVLCDDDVSTERMTWLCHSSIAK